MLLVTDAYVLLTGRNFHCPASPNGGFATENPATWAASNEEIVPLLLVSATSSWLPVNCGFGGPTACCEILAASKDDMAPFAAPVLVGVTVYEPAPKPVSEYVPPGKLVVVDTFGDPVPLISTFETNLVAAGIALPYVTVPLIAIGAVGVGVAVFVGVFVGVSVAVFVGVNVAVFVAVGVEVFVGVNVGVFVAVFVGVKVAVAVGVLVAVFVAVLVAVFVGVKVEVFVGVGVSSFRMVRTAVVGVPNVAPIGDDIVRSIVSSPLNNESGHKFTTKV